MLDEMTGRGAVVAVAYAFTMDDEERLTEYIAAGSEPADAVRQVVQDAIGHTGAMVVTD